MGREGDPAPDPWGAADFCVGRPTGVAGKSPKATEVVFTCFVPVNTPFATILKE